MNSIDFKDQSSGDSSHFSDITTQTITEDLVRFHHPEPGTSLACAIGESKFFESLSPKSSDSEIQSLENIKYKTELCRNFSAYGSCSYSSRCQFAHGMQELRCRNRHPKYKTEICRNFLSGFCKYGSRCQFLHTKDTTTTVAYPNAVTAIGTYLLTNILAQSAVFGLGGPIAHQAALASLTPLQRTTIPFNCGIEMQHIPHLNIFHGPQNQNNSQSCTNQTVDLISENSSINNNRRIRKSSAHI